MLCYEVRGSRKFFSGGGEGLSLGQVVSADFARLLLVVYSLRTNTFIFLCLS